MRAGGERHVPELIVQGPTRTAAEHLPPTAHWESSPGPPSQQQVAIYRLSYPGPQYRVIKYTQAYG